MLPVLKREKRHTLNPRMLNRLLNKKILSPANEPASPGF
jgi:hypothetical protein